MKMLKEVFADNIVYKPVRNTVIIQPNENINFIYKVVKTKKGYQIYVRNNLDKESWGQFPEYAPLFETMEEFKVGQFLLSI